MSHVDVQTEELGALAPQKVVGEKDTLFLLADFKGAENSKRK